MRPVAIAILGVVALLLSSCAATGTVAFGADANARLFPPPVACPTTNSAPIGTGVVVGTKVTKTEDREGKIGPDNVVTTTTTEPAFAPSMSDATPLAESHGAAISETGGGVLKTVFGFLGGVVKGMLGWAFAIP